MNANTVQLVTKRTDASLERYWDEYAEHVQARANIVLTSVVAPFLRKRGWKILCGNGDYHFFDENGKGITKFDQYDREENDPLLKAIVELLNTEIPGMPSDSLGTIMDVPADIRY